MATAKTRRRVGSSRSGQPLDGFLGLHPADLRILCCYFRLGSLRAAARVLKIDDFTVRRLVLSPGGRAYLDNIAHLYTDRVVNIMAVETAIATIRLSRARKRGGYTKVNPSLSRPESPESVEEDDVGEV